MAVLALALPVRAFEQVGGITVYSAGEVADYTLTDGGRTYLDFPGARRYELRSGQSQWFPMPVEEVVAALEQIDFPVRDLNIDIIILHVPRVDQVESSAEGSVVFLTPGRVTYPTEHVHYTVVHEIGHAVHSALMPNSGHGLWLRYAALRGFEMNAGGPDIPHAWRPHEIFAEDFRALFGGLMARFGGRVENHDLLPPDEVEGLREFLLSVTAFGEASAGVTVLPNPSTGKVVLRAPDRESPGCLEDVRVFDVRGRLIRDLGPAVGASEIAWDGRDASGSAVAPGAYVITGRVGGDIFTRKIIRVLP
jgi:hypothetical protein